jgi:multidrug transporter EmrE-like cation transporter
MSPRQLTISQIGLLVSYAAAMSAGQLLFKAAAQLGSTESSLAARLVAIAANGYFVAAMLLYTVLTLLWVWILTFTPLSYAYPFAALAFGMTPLLAAAVFGDPVSLRLMLGCVLIVGGIIVIAF